ncbi:MAG: NADPH:quinone oxidoreductase family protein [Rubrivivax sp.]
MKAVLCTRHGEPEDLQLTEVPPLQHKAGEVVVSVHAASVNFPDTLIIAGRYQFKPPLPFAPGSEVAGVIKAVGEGVEGWAPGDRVIAICGWGGFADEVATPAGKLVRMSEGVPMDGASALVVTYGTTHHALRDRAQLKPGETLLVLGAAGGTGLSAVELGHQMGARVIAAASSPEKLALCRQYGADETIDYSREDLRERLKQLIGGRGVDVVYDPVGGAYTEAALRSMAWGGRLLVIGFTAGDIPKPPLNLALLKGCSIVGVFYGRFREEQPREAEAGLHELMRWLAEGRIRPPITQRRPIEEAVAALREVADRQVLGKIVLTTALGRGEATA